MADIKEVLARELFTPLDEKLLTFLQAARIGRSKKRFHFICASIKNAKSKNSAIVSLCEVKKDKDGYKKRSEWMLSECDQLEGEGADMINFTFSGKVYKFQSATIAERDRFFQEMWTVIQRYHTSVYGKEIPVFGVDAIIQPVIDQFNENERLKAEREEMAKVSDKPESGVSSPKPPLGATGQYTEMTSTEESAIESLMGDFNNAVGNAEEFMSSLTDTLNNLDQKNIQTMVQSEQKIMDLMKYVEHALREVETVENQLDKYDQALNSIESQMSQMKNQESSINKSNENSTTLFNKLGGLVAQIDIDKIDVDALKMADLTQLEGVESSIRASRKLKKVMQVEVPHGCEKMQAVIQQKRLFSELKQHFSDRLVVHLSNECDRERKPGALTGDLNSYTDMSIPSHRSIHTRLLQRRELVQWLKESDSIKYDAVHSTYMEVMGHRYKSEINGLIQRTVDLFQAEVIKEEAEQKEKVKASRRSLSSTIGGSLKKLSTSATSLTRSGSIRNIVTGSTNSLAKKANKIGGSISNLAKAAKKATKKVAKTDADGSQESLEAGKVTYVMQDLDWEKRRQWGQTVRHILEEITPLCQAEEAFCEKYFDVTKKSAITDDSDGMKQNLAKDKFLHATMDKIFGNLLEQLKFLMKSTETNDPLNPLAMMVIFSERVLSSTEKQNQNYLIKTLGYCLVESKRSFDHLVKDHVARMEAFRLRDNKKYGVLPFVREAESFFELSEEIWASAENVRRSELDRAYANLINMVFQTIERSARASQRTPEFVINFQNYHHLLTMFRSTKIPSMKAYREKAKDMYLRYMDEYILQFMGRPLEKLSIFFEGVETLIQSGVQEEDVKYQHEYSKQELKKICKIYNAKDVRKGLQQLYLRAEKHTEQDQHRLLQVVWLKMQDEFLRQYQGFMDLIQRCYDQSGVQLEFTDQDILKTFEDIAQQH